MASNWLRKRLGSLTRLAACGLAMLVLTVGNPADAQPVFGDGVDVGLTSLHTNAAEQEQKVKVLESLTTKDGNKEKEVFEVVVPLNVNDLQDKGKLGDGSFQSADLDFTRAVPSILDTNTRISFSGPVTTQNGVPKTSRLYAVVAGKPKLNSCPVEVQDTYIAFFKDSVSADNKAAELANNDYLVYVTGNKDVQHKAQDTIIKLNCRPNSAGIIVNGKTQKVTVNFAEVAEFLQPRFQGPAKNAPFVYSPKSGSDAIYLVNGRARY